jgi:hypothetical protein
VINSKKNINRKAEKKTTRSEQKKDTTPFILLSHVNIYSGRYTYSEITSFLLLYFDYLIMNEQDIDEKQLNKLSKYMMKARQTKLQA